METRFQQYSDLEIIQRINEGEVRLYEILIRRYNPFLYKIGRSYRYNHQDTEDLMQDAYVNAFFNLKKFENRSSFKTWFTRIMLNLCFQKKQKLSFKNEIIGDDFKNEKSEIIFHHSTNNEKITVNKELGHIIENAIHQIPEDYRIVFTLRELNGLSVAETAEALDISESNVKVRMNRAKGMLQKEIKKMYSADEIFEFNLIYCDAMVEKVMSRINDLKNEDNEKK
ncbi:MAG TPA: sigma-70 family RNA polymerase sigma factor [Hanamia sp.]|nr:sigma-70 family RNA polymerase sigma factor [Hanamia sp.]